MAVHIGTSGWSYDHWQGVLYPHAISVRERLDYYIRRFQTVEVNSTYYRWPHDATFATWQKRLPDEFLMSVKAPRGLTHFARLYSPERWLGRITSGLRRLVGRLGVFLVQLPPQMEYDLPRLSYFLEELPPWLRTALEFRHPSWHREEVYALLEHASAAYCVMSGAGLPCILKATSPIVYVRLHGPDLHHMYGGSYSDEDLRWWADRIREWQGLGHDVFAYFNNDWEGTAVRNAETLKGLLGV